VRSRSGGGGRASASSYMPMLRRAFLLRVRVALRQLEVRHARDIPSFPPLLPVFAAPRRRLLCLSYERLPPISLLPLFSPTEVAAAFTPPASVIVRGARRRVRRQQAGSVRVAAGSVPQDRHARTRFSVLVFYAAAPLC